MKLFRKLMKRFTNELGVTLIELLAVIVILGIIAAIGIPAVLNSRQDAERSTGLANAQTMTQVAHRLLLNGQMYDSSAASSGGRFNFQRILVESGIPFDAQKLNENAHSYVADGGVYSLDTATGHVTYVHDGDPYSQSVNSNDPVGGDQTNDPNQPDDPDNGEGEDSSESYIPVQH